MEGHEVNELHKPENRAAENDERSLAYLKVKLNVFNVAFHKIEEASLPPAGDDSATYGWVPFPTGAFVDMLLEAFSVLGKGLGAKFLDVGSGIGTKLMLASVLFDAHGIELDEDYIRRSVALGCKNVSCDDALDFARYGEYDLIYFYRPFRSDQMQRVFESKVAKDMRPGALLAPMHSLTKWDEAGFERAGQFVWRKRCLTN